MLCVYAFIHVPQIYSIHIIEKCISLFLHVPIFVVLLLSFFSKYLNLITINQFVVTLLHDGHTLTNGCETGRQNAQFTGPLITCSASYAYWVSSGLQDAILIFCVHDNCVSGFERFATWEGRNSTTKVSRVKYRVRLAPGKPYTKGP
jgi:hypothetical protein